MKFIAVLFLIFFSINIYSQNIWGGYLAKEWSKELSVFYGNAYLTKNIFKDAGTGVYKFESEALAASNSGEITTVLYRSEDGGAEGLLLCFYGNYWNDAGVIYTGYQFRNLPKESAFEFLGLVKKNIDEYKQYLTKGSSTIYSGNNIYFKYEDMNVIIGYSFGNLTIRIFWNTFDSSWDISSFEKSKKRFEKKNK